MQCSIVQYREKRTVCELDSVTFPSAINTASQRLPALERGHASLWACLGSEHPPKCVPAAQYKETVVPERKYQPGLFPAQTAVLQAHEECQDVFISLLAALWQLERA